MGQSSELPQGDAGRAFVGSAIEVMPVVVVSRTFPARPSSIPEIREFVRSCLADSPLTPEETREVDGTVSAALLDAAGPTGAIQVTFRIFPDHAEVDVLRSAPDSQDQQRTAAPDLPERLQAPRRPEPPETFAAWMAQALQQRGLTQEAAARQLGVSVKTVGRWVGGTTEPRLRDLRRIRELFGPTPFA